MTIGDVFAANKPTNKYQNFIAEAVKILCKDLEKFINNNIDEAINLGEESIVINSALGVLGVQMQIRCKKRRTKRERKEFIEDMKKAFKIYTDEMERSFF